MPRPLVKSLAVLATLAFGHAALADPVNDDQKAAARMLGTEGVRLAMSGDCANAVDKLARAEALVHAPTTAVPLARCDIQLGKLVMGTEILNQVVHETLAPNAPRSWVDAKKTGEELLDETTPRIARLRIHVDGLEGAGPAAKVAVDGVPVPGVLLDNDRPTDPGPHHVTAEADGYQPAAYDVTLADGQAQAISLHLTASATASATKPVAAGPAEASKPAPPPSRGSRVPAYVLFGGGAVGIAVGSVFGVLALTTKSHLDSECNGSKMCGPGAQGDIDALHLDALVSTVAFGVGIVSAGFGTYFLATARDDTSPKATGVRLRPWVGAGSAGLAGSFQ